MPFTISKLSIPEVLEITSRQFEDARGWFAELFKTSEFKELGISRVCTQGNISHSTHGVVRGLHFQKNPHAQAKLVLPMSGVIFDVAVDLRSGSPTYGQWTGKLLDAAKVNMLYIPQGFAHGFSVVSQEARVMYLCDNEYAPEAEGGIIFNDVELNIDWQVSNPIVSAKDLELPRFSDVKHNFTY